MKVGVLTGGGDCPGAQRRRRAVVRKGVQEHGCDSTGFRDGWRGPLEGDTVPLDIPAVRGILPRGGTVLGSWRTNPRKQQGGIRRIKGNLSALGVDALITLGGEDTLGVATRLADEYGVLCLGVPKTVDNDLSATDCTFGLDTAVGIATEAVDRLHTTAESHMRAIDCVRDGDFGKRVVLYGTDIVRVPIAEATARLETVDPALYEEVGVFFG
ncbi:6-phosphofructokinase [Streptomyces collinus]